MIQVLRPLKRRHANPPRKSGTASRWACGETCRSKGMEWCMAPRSVGDGDVPTPIQVRMCSLPHAIASQR